MDNKYTFLIEAKLNGIDIGNDEVVYFTTSRKFETHRYPTRVLCLALPPKTYFEVLKGTTPDKPYINVHLKVSAIENKDDGSTLINRTMYTGVYKGIVDKSSPNSDIPNTEDDLDQVYRLRVALFDNMDLSAFSGGTVSGMFNNIKVDGIIKYAFESCRSSAKLKLAAAKPDNIGNIKSLAIKPMGFIQCMEFLDKEYGVYSSDMNIYIENNVVYLLNTQKSDSGMGAILPDPKLGKIIVDVQPKEVAMPSFYDMVDVDGHKKYNIFNNNTIVDDISAENIVRATTVTVNSDGSTSKTKCSDKALDHISSEIRVEDGRNRAVTKSYRNPKFSATINIQDLPVEIFPFSVVRYIANRRIGDCMVSESLETITHGTYNHQLRIKSYDELMDADIQESKAGKNMNRSPK